MTSATAAVTVTGPAEATMAAAARLQPARWPAPALVNPLAGVDVVVVDVETTGCQPGQDEITEIGAVRLHGGAVTAEYRSLANPGRPIPAAITELTGITDGMVQDAPPVAAVLAGFLAFAEGSVLAAHNAPFDLAFLAAAARGGGLPWPAFAVIDTAVLARLVLGAPEVPDRKLSTLAGHFRTRVAPCHRALPDASATADVLLGLLGLRPPGAPVALRRAGQAPGGE